jgi:hypothetical protein
VRRSEAVANRSTHRSRAVSSDGDEAPAAEAGVAGGATGVDAFLGVVFLGFFTACLPVAFGRGFDASVGFDRLGAC